MNNENIRFVSMMRTDTGTGNESHNLRWKALSRLIRLFIVLSLIFIGIRANCNEFFWLDAKRLHTLLAGTGLEHDYYPGVRRDEAGTSLLSASFTNGNTLIVILSEKGRQEKVLPGHVSAITDDGRPICSHRDNVLVFQTGEQIPLAPGGASRWGFSPNGTLFFFLREFPAAADIFLAAEPLTPLIKLPQNFLPQKILAQTNEVFVFGLRYEDGKGLGSLTGLVFSIRKPVPERKTEIDLSRFGGVLDMDIKSNLLLVEGKREMFNTWGIYNLETHKYRSLGLKKGYGFFLTPRFQQYLEKICGP